VTGLQGGLVAGGGPLTIAACCKHFLANSLESWHGHTRHNFDAQVPARDLVDYYLPAFKSCVMEGRAKGVMCSYNSVNGVPMCANGAYLAGTLRGTWGFDGYVTSDCDAVGDISTAAPGGHGYANATEGAALALRAGTDMDCGQWGKHAYRNELPAAVAAGLATEADVDVALTRLTAIQMELGLFDRKDGQPLFQLGLSDVRRPAHTALALEGARQSLTLLRNPGGTLPLRKAGRKGAARTIAVLGPHMNAQKALVSNYNGQPCLNATGGIRPDGGFGCLTTPLAAITAANGGANVVAVAGCDLDSDTDNVADAVAAAKGADVAVLLVGIDATIEGEGHDRYNISLPGVQPKLLAAVLASGTPTIVVLLHGGATSLGAEALAALSDGAQAHALLDAPYGGERGGQAIADVIFGDFNPVGRLANTVYPPDFVDQVPLTNMSLAPWANVNPGRTYMYYTGKAEHEFGDGLSYSSFSVELAGSSSSSSSSSSIGGESVMTTTTTTTGSAAFNVTVRNSGAVGGGARVLAFWRPTVSLPHAPTLHKKLFAFEGVAHLGAGEAATLVFELPATALAVSNERGERIVSAGEYEVLFKSGSADGAVLATSLTVTGLATTVERYDI
jgi:beta-glucosidase-like glycosyl hydrolase